MAEQDVLAELAAAKRRVKELEKAVKRRAGMRQARPAGEVTERGPGSWRVRVYLGPDPATGRRRYVSETVKGSKKDADDKLREMLSERTSGTLGTGTRDTIGEYLDRWLETVVKPSKRARTHHDYERVVTHYVKPYLGSAKLATVKPADVRAMVLALREKGLSPRTCGMAREVLRCALNRAIRDGLIRTNPARDEVVKEALPPKRKKDRVTAPAELLKKYVSTARGERLGAFFVLQLYAGLRPGEGLALRWSDLQGNAVRVQRALIDILVGKEGIDPYEEPKTEGSRRAVVVPDVVIRFLAAHRKKQAKERLKAGGAWNDSDLIFCDEVGRPLKQRHVRHFFDKFVKAAGLPEGLTPYGLRHSCATLLMQQGVSAKVVQERLGHADVGLTLSTYSHVMPGMQEQAADVLARLAK